VRTWGPSGAGAALRRAQAVSRLARRTGCGVDEAAELLDGQLTRRAFLGVAGAGEQTSPNYQGYIEGALRSGYRCAAEVTKG
jgi:hypothetical protein